MCFSMAVGQVEVVCDLNESQVVDLMLVNGTAVPATWYIGLVTQTSSRRRYFSNRLVFIFI